jgi:hypothetical protein
MNGGAIVSSVTYGTVLALGAAFFVRSTDVRVRELLPRRREAGDLWAAMRGLRRA